MKVLVSAFACAPGKGSEAGVGWNWVLQAAKSHDLWVLTNAINRDAIESYLDAHPVPAIHFVYFDVPKWMYFLPRKGPFHKLYYLVWQALIVPASWGLHRRVKIQLAHHLTYNAIDAPGFLWLLPIPFLWGPVGGGQIAPTAYRRYFGRRWLLERLRILKKQSLKFDPVVRLAIRKSIHILAANEETERRLRGLHARNISRMLEAGVTMPGDRDRSPTSGTITIVWVGLFVHRKAPLLAIEAFHHWLLTGGRGRMLMVGDGPLLQEIQKEVIAREIHQHVEFLGRVSHEIISDVYAEGDIFLFTSLQDTSGNVVLEAMSHGLPVITLNHHGAAEMVTSDTGVLVPVTDVSHAIAAISAGINTLATDTDKRMKMGAIARERTAQVFSWDSKAQRIASLYQAIANAAQ